MLAVVVPTCRPESLKTFVRSWQTLFERHDIELIIVEDCPETWAVLPDFIPQRTGAIRSWGFLQAYQRGYDVIALDDDCLPPDAGDPIQEYLDAFRTRFSVGNYFDVGHTFGLEEYMRGFPFGQRRVATPLLQYGGWHNVPDMDAVTQAEHEKQGAVTGYKFDPRVLAIPVGLGFTACIMNAAMKREAIPMLYQLIMGVDRVGYDRYDDLWSGLFAKKICDHLERPILINGKASIVHTRASNTEQNLKKEADGYALNDVLWGKLETIDLESQSILDCYRELTERLDPGWFGPAGRQITKAMHCWIDALS